MSRTSLKAIRRLVANIKHLRARALTWFEYDGTSQRLPGDGDVVLLHTKSFDTSGRLHGGLFVAMYSESSQCWWVCEDQFEFPLAVGDAWAAFPEERFSLEKVCPLCDGSGWVYKSSTAKPLYWWTYFRPTDPGRHDRPARDQSYICIDDRGVYHFHAAGEPRLLQDGWRYAILPDASELPPADEEPLPF